MRSIINVATPLALAASMAFGIVGCGEQGPYEAPLGSELLIEPDDLQVYPGSVVQLRPVVWNPDEETYYNNIQVRVQSLFSGVILVPQSAILSYSDSDTTWQVAGEQYYELTQVDDQIDPNYLLATTDAHGGADVFVYFKCLPYKCEGYLTDTCAVAAGDIPSDVDPTTCELQQVSLMFQISTDAQSMTFDPS